MFTCCGENILKYLVAESYLKRYLHGHLFSGNLNWRISTIFSIIIWTKRKSWNKLGTNPSFPVDSMFGKERAGNAVLSKVHDFLVVIALSWQQVIVNRGTPALTSRRRGRWKLWRSTSSLDRKQVPKWYFFKFDFAM